ncbi:MAG: hypothetical protein FWH26_06725 [Oscillospiraceae bacterium]|nr:hypothetical protein [Oscillospiraceae bacterium]
MKVLGDEGKILIEAEEKEILSLMEADRGGIYVQSIIIKKPKEKMSK